MLLITKHTIKSSNVKFKIITDYENGTIKFIDENKGELNWENTLNNQVLVSNMVNDLESEVLNV